MKPIAEEEQKKYEEIIENINNHKDSDIASNSNLNQNENIINIVKDEIKIETIFEEENHVDIENKHKENVFNILENDVILIDDDSKNNHLTKN